VQALPIGPDPAYATAVSAALAKLATDAGAGRTALSHSRSDASGYRAGAKRIGSAFSAAASTLSALTPSPLDAQANTAFASSLRKAGDGYRTLASRASRTDTARTRAAADAATGRAKAADKALAAILKAGYSGKISPRVPAKPLPALKRKPPATHHAAASTTTNASASTGTSSTSSSSTGSQQQQQTYTPPASNTSTQQTQQHSSSNKKSSKPKAPVTIEG
jgi:hypothetical protein